MGRPLFSYLFTLYSPPQFILKHVAPVLPDFAAVLPPERLRVRLLLLGALRAGPALALPAIEVCAPAKTKLPQFLGGGGVV